MPPSLIQLGSIQSLLEWYSINLCNAYLEDPRQCRVRFSETSFVHLIQLKTKFGSEPKNKRMTIDQIRSGRINFVKGRFDEQRASELSWAEAIARTPDRIVSNWQALGEGDEAYIKNLGTDSLPKYRVLICKVIGTLREAWTVFPRENVGEKELIGQIWP